MANKLKTITWSIARRTDHSDDWLGQLFFNKIVDIKILHLLRWVEGKYDVRLLLDNSPANRITMRTKGFFIILGEKGRSDVDVPDEFS